MSIVAEMSARGRISFPVVIGIATAFGVSSTIQSLLLSRVKGIPDPIYLISILNLVYWYVPALLAPVIVKLAIRYPFRRGHVWRSLLVHLSAVLAYSIIHTAAIFATRVLVGVHLRGPGWWWTIRVEYLNRLDWMLMTYSFVVGVTHALEFRRESERRALDSAQLETRLVEAQLQALQRQLQPHFLFNT